MQLYTAPWVLPLSDETRAIADGGIVVDGSRIASVGTAAELRARFPEAKRKHCSDRVLMPGLVNCHMHSGLLRGTAEGLKLWDWLRLYIDPMHRVLQPDEAETASWICYAEALLSGTTTVVDMWRYLDGSGRVAE